MEIYFWFLFFLPVAPCCVITLDLSDLNSVAVFQPESLDCEICFSNTLRGEAYEVRLFTAGFSKLSVTPEKYNFRATETTHAFSCLLVWKSVDERFYVFDDRVVVIAEMLHFGLLPSSLIKTIIGVLFMLLLSIYFTNKIDSQFFSSKLN